MNYRMSLVVLVFLVLLLPSTTMAQEEQEAIEVSDLFTWATSSSPDWAKGGLFAALGLVGALVTVFSLIGGAVPGTAGFAMIEANTQRVEENQKVLDSLIEENADPQQIQAVGGVINELRDDLTAARNRQFAAASFLYAILGAFFAAMLARDLLQALVIGAGWTSFLGALGLRRDYADRKTLKDEAADRLGEELSKLEGLKPELLMQARVARAL